MSLPIDTSDGVKFYKTLGMDCELIPNEYNKFDLNFIDGDLVQLTGHDSLKNGIVIAIMTRFEELFKNDTYFDFGCRVHELIKANKSNMIIFKIESYIDNVLKNMRRIKKVDEIIVTDTHDDEYSYHVLIRVTSISDECVSVELNL